MEEEKATTLTIKELGELLKEKLSFISNLNAVYVGKTEHLESAERRHDIDYDRTIPIATGSPTIISKCEDYLIKTLRSSLNGIKVDNMNAGSAGNSNANILYVSLDYTPKTDEELFDDDLVDKPLILID